MAQSLPDTGIASVINGNSGGSNIVKDGAGNTVKRIGNRNWRNNNPGNIIKGGFSNSHGAIGDDGTFAIFPSADTGYAAMEALLFGPKYINLTIDQAINKWDPEPNAPYHVYVTKQLGLPGTTKMSALTPEQRKTQVKAMATFEGFKAGQIVKTDGTGPVPANPTTPVQPQPKPTVEPPPPPPSDFTKYRQPISPADDGSYVGYREFDSIDISKPLVNELHKYPSYTYGLSLHLLNPDEYNAVVSGSNYTPKRVLVASAGRFNNTPGPTQFIRSPYFADDFYFDNFETTTVIGVNAQSRNTNAIEFNFTLLEPYGLTLINRLLDQANDPEMLCSNYLDMIYLLQVDFYASDDAGVPVGIIPGTTKRFPIKLTQMQIKAGVKGSEYQINAVPYNHSAYEQTTISIPANFEIVAGSIGEFFQSGTAINPKSKVSSLTGALNGWQQDLVKNNKIAEPDTYSFNIDPKIAQSLFASAGGLSPRDTSMADSKNTNAVRQGNLGSNTSAFDAQTRTFSINAGTSIDKVIDYTMRSSDYIKNQINIPDGMSPEAYLTEKAKNANQPLNWYRIVPTVTLGKFDNIRKVYARNITYSVQPYTIYNVKSDVAPQGKIDQYVKVYNYMYTGRNDDVLDFDINFNTLYYTAQTAYRSALTASYKSPNSNVQSTNDQNADAYKGSEQSKNSIMPMVVKPQVYNAKARATGGTVEAKAVAVADLEDSLMTLSSADMLNVQITIVGDPQFLKQDDIFYSPTSTGSSFNDDPRLTPNGSLRTDYGEIYVQLNFRTPTDINESTGLYEFGSNYRSSLFSGIYKVLTVKSTLKGGVFTQILDLIRLPNQQDYDYPTQQKTNSNQRTSDISALSASKLDINNNVVNVPNQSGNKLAESMDIQSAQKQLAGKVTEATNIVKEQTNLKGVLDRVSAIPINKSNEPQITQYIPGQR